MATWRRLSTELRARLDAAVPAIVLVVSIGIFAAAAIWEQGSIEREAQKQMLVRADRLASEVARRITTTVYGLNGVKVYLGTKPKVNRADFNAYVESLDISNQFPALRGFSFVQRVMRSELDQFVVDSRADGATTFALRQMSEPNHDDFYIVKFIEPAALNEGAPGLGIGSDPLRRIALQQAIDTKQKG